MTTATDFSTRQERVQAQMRLAISAGSGVAVCAMVVFSAAISLHGMRPALTVISLHASCSALWLLWVMKRPQGRVVRVPISMVLDLVCTCLAIAAAKEHGTFFYPVVLWTVMGYGLRHGAQKMVLSSVIGLICFYSIVLTSDYWQQNQGMGIGLLVGIAVLPAFFMNVLRRLEALNEQLHDELQRSQAAERAKDQFLANMSHEIRTPLNGVMGMAALLDDGSLRTDQQANVGLMVRSGEALLGVINDILDFSKLNNAGIRLNPAVFDLVSMLNDVVDLLRSQASTKNLELRCHIDFLEQRCVMGDATRVRQIVYNLLGNAIKFTEQGSVSLRATMPDTRTVVIEVRDTGIGIASDQQAAVFDPFEQASSHTSGSYGGTGLGLAIGRELAQLMNGDISLESEPGQGSTFRVHLELPAAACEEMEPVRTTTTVATDLQLMALLAEDNLINQRVATRLLARVGIKTVVAANGREAVDMLPTRPFDLVFMDVRMPELDGMEATRTIRARDDALARIPIIALTADADAQSVANCLAAGMDAHLAKPLRLDDVLETVDNVLAATCVAS